MAVPFHLILFAYYVFLFVLLLLYGRSLVFHVFIFFRRCFPIDFIVIVLMLRSLMPRCYFCICYRFYQIYLYFYVLFRPSHIFFRDALCVFTSLFIGKVCLFACVYFSAFICWSVSVRSWVKHRISEPFKGHEPWRSRRGQLRDAMPCEGRRAAWQSIVTPISDLDQPSTQPTEPVLYVTDSSRTFPNLIETAQSITSQNEFVRELDSVHMVQFVHYFDTNWG